MTLYASYCSFVLPSYFRASLLWMLASLFIVNFWLVFRNESKYCLIWWHLVGISRLFQSLFLLLLLLCSSTIIFYIRVTNPYKKKMQNVCRCVCVPKDLFNSWTDMKSQPPPPPPTLPQKKYLFFIFQQTFCFKIHISYKT